MSRSLRNLLLLSSIVTLGSFRYARAACSEPDPTLTITVRVYNYARVPPGALARAEGRATRLFRKIGVETVWLGYSHSLDDAERDPARSTPPSPSDLFVRILPRSMTAHLWSACPRTKFALGFALSPVDGGFGRVASIFFHRVRELAKRVQHRAAEPVIILGHAMAHEIGHLLLNTESHASTGIMHVPWDLEQLKRAATGRLLFTPKEAERMRAQVRARMNAAQARGVD